MNILRLGTRGSQLALWQARTAAALVEQAGGPHCEIVIIKTSGDRLAEAPLSDIGGKRLFVKEIEDALLRHDVDFAVHSCKDMPAVLPDGLAIGAVLQREDPRDVLVLPQQAHGPQAQLATLDDVLQRLGESARIGTSSVRRIAELTRLLPTASFQPIRGNLDTRLRKLDAGGYDALVLAAAGMRRLGFADRISHALAVDACVPAPGQGAIAIELRVDDTEARVAVARIDDAATARAVEAERALVATLGGGCQTPVGAVALADADDLDLRAVVVSLDGHRVVRGRDRAPRGEATTLGVRLGRRLIEQGADAILEEVRRNQGQ
ncbi:MAG TPA: hydroxymethylbilane synthase [Vicinamibacterales bacterium]